MQRSDYCCIKRNSLNFTHITMIFQFFYRNNYPNPKGYATSDKRNRYGEMPSRDENLMNDKPRGGILQDERSDVEKVHDLMRQEPSISASSSASMNSSLLLSTKYWLPMATLLAYTFLSRNAS